MLFILDSLPITYLQVFNEVLFICPSSELTHTYGDSVTQPSAYVRQNYEFCPFTGSSRSRVACVVESPSSFTFSSSGNIRNHLWTRATVCYLLSAFSGLCHTLACHNRRVGYSCLPAALRISMCRLQMLQFVTGVTTLNQSIRRFVPQLPLCVFRAYLFTRGFIPPQRSWRPFWSCWLRDSGRLWLLLLQLLNTPARRCLAVVSDGVSTKQHGGYPALAGDSSDSKRRANRGSARVKSVPHWA